MRRDLRHSCIHELYLACVWFLTWEGWDGPSRFFGDGMVHARWSYILFGSKIWVGWDEMCLINMHLIAINNYWLIGVYLWLAHKNGISFTNRSMVEGNQLLPRTNRATLSLSAVAWLPARLGWRGFVGELAVRQHAGVEDLLRSSPLIEAPVAVY
jgi:hypothetical protein